VALASISLRGLRNLAPTTIEFDRGANYLFGPNGAGKTNLLEAIHYLAIGRSFRRCPDADLLGFGKNVLAVSGADEKGEGAEIRFDGREKRLLRDDVPVQKLSEYFGWLPVVVLLLEDIELVRGAPGIRRSFLDVAIAKTGARAKAGAGIDKLEARAAEAGGNGRDAGRSYIALMGEYRRAVSQYNRLLEKAGRGREQGAAELEAWEQEVARTGAPVCEMRLAKLGELLEYAAGHYERLAGHGAEFSYRSSVEGIGTQSESSGDSVMALSRAFRQRLAMTRERALVLGHALVGPHRDDIRITRGGRELRRFGSVGEQRLAGIALRLAEADMILSAGRQRPVFLLDEVASELDERRSRMVLEMVAERGQMVYAAARRIARPREGSSDGCLDAVHDAAAPDHFSGKEFHVEAGKVSEVS
jgi:DNA replication and repair protein RecF